MNDFFTLTFMDLLIYVPPFLLLEALFSGSELALLSADRIKLRSLEHSGNKGAKLAIKLLQHPERILSTTLFVTSICIICISILVTLTMIANFKDNGELLSILLTSTLVVIFGEFLPKSIYQRSADRLAPLVAYPVYAFYWLFFPITRALSSYTGFISKIISGAITSKPKGMRDELRSLLKISGTESELKSSERKMIRRIFEFKESEAKHALIPLVKVEAIEETEPVKDALERFIEHQHSRMAVYSERIDNIVGILEVSDLFAVTDLNATVKTKAKTANFVAESQNLIDVLFEMSKENWEMVVVVDEYGGATGILTFEDIVEEVVGEISDEHDSESSPIKVVSANEWLVDAQASIRQINDELSLDLAEGEYETLAGFLLYQFGRIPKARDELFFNTSRGALKFTIQKANTRRIETVFIEITETSKG